jgi:hypothetical protein
MTVFSTMPCLEVLELSGFTDGHSDWIVAMMRSIIPRDRKIERMILFPSIHVTLPDEKLSPLPSLDEFALCAQQVDLTVHLEYEAPYFPIPDSAKISRLLMPLSVARGTLKVHGIIPTSRVRYGYSDQVTTDSDNEVTTNSDNEVTTESDNEVTIESDNEVTTDSDNEAPTDSDDEGSEV